MAKLELIIENGDITSYATDAIVNAANVHLLAGGGVCGAIFAKAGYDSLQAECDKLAPIKTGDAVITNGYNLKAKHIIHAAGPVYLGKSSEKDLRNAYLNSLKLADSIGLKTIAFPSISTGIYGYPLNEAAIVALDAILSFEASNLKTVYMVCFDETTYRAYNNEFLQIKSKNNAK